MSPTAAPAAGISGTPDVMFYQSLLDELEEGVYFVDCKRQITYWSKGAERLSGFTSEEVVGRRCADGILVHVDENGRCICQNGCPLAATMEDGARRSAEVHLRHKAGHRVPVLVQAAPIFSEFGALMGAVETFRDRSHRFAEDQKIRNLARLVLLDSTTGIGNRRYIQSAVESRLTVQRQTGVALTVCMIDIDRFKQLNDTMGHAAGDEALRVVARTLAASVGQGAALGRWGGEEFVVAADQIDQSQADAYATKMLSMIRASTVCFHDRQFGVTVSIGATTARADDDLSSLMERADRALYLSKNNGRDRVTLLA